MRFNFQSYFLEVIYRKAESISIRIRQKYKLVMLFLMGNTLLVIISCILHGLPGTQDLYKYVF